MATRLTLPNDQWIDVRDKLKVRDKRDVHSYSVDGVSSDGLTYRFNVVKHQIGTAAVRIVSWLLKDEDGKSIPYPVGKSSFKDRTEAIEGLDEDAFDEITKVLTAHFKVIEAEVVDEKKEIPEGVIVPGPTSVSAS